MINYNNNKQTDNSTPDTYTGEITYMYNGQMRKDFMYNGEVVTPYMHDGELLCRVDGKEIKYNSLFDHPNSLYNYSKRAEDITRIVELVISEAKRKSKDLSDADIDRGVRVMELYYLDRLIRGVEGIESELKRGYR